MEPVNQNAPTIKTDKGILFYNPGDKIEEPFSYSVDGADIHTIARFVVKAEEQSFFRVPTAITFLAENFRKTVDFPASVCTKFKDRGVVMIDDEWVPSGDEEEDDRIPIARDEEEAKEKGERIWRRYLFTIVRRWQALVQEIRAKGGIPEEASGFTKRALKILNMRDPAIYGQQQAVEQSNTPQSDENAALRAELDETKSMLGKILSQLEARDSVATSVAAEEAVSAATARRQGNRRQPK